MSEAGAKKHIVSPRPNIGGSLTNIEKMIQEEIVRHFGIGGCAPLGVDPLVFLFPKIEEEREIYLLEAA